MIEMLLGGFFIWWIGFEELRKYFWKSFGIGIIGSWSSKTFSE